MISRVQRVTSPLVAAAILLTLTCLASRTEAQEKRSVTIYEESQVPPYTLPDPLICADGSEVADAQTWWDKRRPEILKLCEDEWFGKTTLGRPKKMKFVVRDEKHGARGGIATRLRIGVLFDGSEAGPQMEILVYLPEHTTGQVPVILLMNFQGNYATTPEADIPLPTHWVGGYGNADPSNHAQEKLRGSVAYAFQYDYALQHGYGVATIGYGEVEPDFNGGDKIGVRGKLPSAATGGDRMGAIGTWAWGLSRAVDYLQTNKRIDPKRIGVQGHSRLGKAALWAAAQDQRFAFVISNESGAGGAALNKRIFGETVAVLNHNFPHWFCPNFNKYSDNEAAMSVDSHELIALIAPRPVLITSAVEDRWSDPYGEFLAGVGADPVYRLLCGDGIPDKTYPAPSHVLNGRIGYYVRPGKHDVLLEDWQNYVSFADRYMKVAR